MNKLNLKKKKEKKNDMEAQATEKQARGQKRGRVIKYYV